VGRRKQITNPHKFRQLSIAEVSLKTRSSSIKKFLHFLKHEMLLLHSTEPTNESLRRKQGECSSRFSLSYILIVNIYISLGLNFFYPSLRFSSYILRSDFAHGRKVFPSPTYPDRKWGPHSTVFIGYGGCLFEDRATGALS